jgi:hypothetical protein
MLLDPEHISELIRSSNQRIQAGRILAGDIRESVRLTQQSISGSQRRIRETDQFLKNSRKVLASVHPVKPWIERIGPRLDLGPGHKGAR